MLNFDADVKKTTVRHQCENPHFRAWFPQNEHNQRHWLCSIYARPKRSQSLSISQLPRVAVLFIVIREPYKP